MKKKLLVVGFLVILSSLANMSVIAADIAPPLQPSGAILSPADFAETDIQMVYESVRIYVEDSGNLYYPAPTSDTVNARVTANFDMLNPGTEDVTMDIVFPLTNIEGYGDGRFDYPEVQNFEASLNYEPLVWETVTTPNPRGEDEPPIRWAQFEVTFPADDMIFIDVSYEIQSTGYFPVAAFSYVLETGAAWAGPIRHAHLTLELPYEASEENVQVGKGVYYGMGGYNNPEPTFSLNQVEWDWENLEPTRDDNWAISIWAPHIWQEIIGLRQEMAKGKRGAARDITRWYDGLIIDRGIREGAEQLVPLNIEAYEQAMDDDEWDDDVKARYANFLLFLYGYGRESDKYPGMLDEVYALAKDAQEMDLFNTTALDVLNQLEKTYDFVPPEKAPAPTETAIVLPTETKDDVVIPDELQDGDNFTIIYILGGALAIALLVIVFLIYRMGLKKEKV